MSKFRPIKTEDNIFRLRINVGEVWAYKSIVFIMC